MVMTQGTELKLTAAVSRGLTPSPTLALNELVNQLWAEGRTVYHMGFGESRFPVHPKVAAALAANAHQISYLPGQGLGLLREKIAEFYSRRMHMPFSPAQVIVGPGSKSLIYAAQMALDGNLLLPTPSWVSYGPQARLLGKEVRRVPASPREAYALRIDRLDEAVQGMPAGQKLLALNSPSNPTSQMYDAAFLEELADYCREQRILVISDEIYAMTAHGGKPHVSIAHYYPEGSVVLGGLSKHLSLGGWRLGLALVPAGGQGETLMRALRVVAGEIWSSPTAPVQYAAVVAFGDADVDRYINECAALHAIRTRFVWRKLVELGVECPEPDGGFYCFPNFDCWREPLAGRGVRTSAELAHHLLEEYQIATLPGSAFGAPAEDLSLRLASSYLDVATPAAGEALLAAYRADADPEALMRDHHPETQEAVRRLADFVAGLAAEQ